MNVDRDAWVAAGGDAAHHDLYAEIGKVAAFSQGDARALATIHPARPTLGLVGDWVGGLEVVRAAEGWLAEQGCVVARGPMEMGRWFHYRAALGPFGEPPFSFEPVTPAGRWLDAGYVETERYVSWVSDREALVRASLDRAAALSARGYRVVPLSEGGQRPSEVFRERLGALHALLSAAFADVEGFVPVAPEALYAYYAGFDAAVDPRLTWMALDPSGMLVGLVLSVPDRAQPRRRWYLVLALAVLPSHRHLGVGSWLLAAAHQAGRRAGYAAGIHCFARLRTGDDSRFYAGRPFRRYVLLEKALSRGAGVG